MDVPSLIKGHPSAVPVPPGRPVPPVNLLSLTYLCGIQRHGMNIHQQRLPAANVLLLADGPFQPCLHILVAGEVLMQLLSHCMSHLVQQQLSTGSCGRPELRQQ